VVDASELEAIPLFRGLSRKEREQVAKWSDVVDLPAGYHLLEQGRFPHEFYVLLDGTVDVEQDGQRIASMGPGAFFGEIAILEDDRRTASVIATTPVSVLVMTAREFDEMRTEMAAVAAVVERAAKERMSGS
jgi:CRP/FNR family cyclic AMP-dependent transcriptional regulator